MNVMHKTSGLAVSLIAAAGLFSAVASSAHAATPSAATRSVAVSYRYLDLGSPGAVAAVYRQFAVAAERACGSNQPRDLRERRDWRQCRNVAVSDAIARFVEARLAALHRNPEVSSPVNLPDLAARL